MSHRAFANPALGVGPRKFGLRLGAIGISAAAVSFLLARLSSNPRRPPEPGEYIPGSTDEANSTSNVGSIPSLSC
jgi:hypothetical protein